MKIAGKFISYEETDYDIQGKLVTGRLLNVQADGQLLAFKGGSISRELVKGVFQQYETGGACVLDCSVKVKEYTEKNDKGEDRKVKVNTLFINDISGE